MQKYSFKEIEYCEMCGSETSNHKLLGQRLNKTQGFKPKKKSGITVSIQQCQKCELIYSNPLPIPDNIQDHYGTPPEDYWVESYFNWTEVREMFEEANKGHGADMITNALRIFSYPGDTTSLEKTFQRSADRERDSSNKRTMFL